MRTVRRSGLVAVVVMAVVASVVAADAQVVGSKLKAKFSSKKITVKGKVKATGDWPTTLRVALVDEQGNEIATASDTVRGPSSFEVELGSPRGKKFQRDELMNARVRYSVMRERRTESESVKLAEICPNLVKKHWW